jgi:hypothetical protein
MVFDSPFSAILDFSDRLFRVSVYQLMIPGFSLRSNPGLKLANAFGVLARWTTDS